MFSFPLHHRHTLKDLLSDGMDRHCHLLWGLDDGARTLQESQDMVNTLKACGFRGAWCTPHIMAIQPENTERTILTRYREALDRLELNGFDLRLAAEYRMDAQLLAKLDRKCLLTYDGRRLLVEFPQITLPHGWEDILFQIQVCGYIPVLAHPERYIGILSDVQLEQIHHKGVEFQLNLPSLRNHWGKNVRKLALRLLARGLYSWAGTDAHRAREITPA